VIRRHLPFLVVLIALLAAWQTLHVASGSADVPSPDETLLRLLRMMVTASFWDDVAATSIAFVAALVISVAGGIALGVLLGLSRTTNGVVEPVLTNFYALPKVTLYPIVLAFFGLGLAPKVAFGVMHGLVPITLFTTRAIAQIRPVHLRTARTLGLSGLKTVQKILLPAILPDLVSAVRIGFSLSLLGVLIGEMFAAKAGLGFAAVNAIGLGDTAAITAIGLFLVIFAVSANIGLLALENRQR
jgi:NitT/TauT family transport system permease protein